MTKARQLFLQWYGSALLVALLCGASSRITTQDISNKAITYAKIQDSSATDKLLGRSTAGAGSLEEIACTAAGRAIIDDTDAAAQRTTLGLGSVDNTADAAKSVASAAILTTARAINGVNFNGSAPITVTAAGSTLSDTVPLTKGGTGQITAALAFDALTLQGADVASSSTTNIFFGHDGSFVNITGTTTITSFDSAVAGVRRIVKFSGALTLTHNSNITLPGGVSIPTVAGDTAEFISLGSSWLCLWYSPATVTGSGSTVKRSSPTLVSPVLGTPTTLVGTNITGTGASFTAGKATILATARAINGVNFDGSAAITIPGIFTVARQTLTDADLTDAVNGHAQSVNLTDIPANSVLVGAVMKTKTAFSGGGIVTLSADLGSIETGYDLLAATSASNFSANTGAVSVFIPNFAAITRSVTFTPDVAHTLLALTAGTLDVWLIYMPGVTPS